MERGTDGTGHGHTLATLEGTEHTALLATPMAWRGTEHGAREYGWDPTCSMLFLPHRNTRIARDVCAAPQMLGLDFLCLASQEHHAVPLEYK